MEGVGDDVFVHVVGQVVIEALADVPVDRLQLDEDQRQAVDEADQIGAAVVVGRAHAGELQLAHGEEAVRTGRVVEVDHAGAGGFPADPERPGIPRVRRCGAADRNRGCAAPSNG